MIQKIRRLSQQVSLAALFLAPSLEGAGVADAELVLIES